MLDTNGLLSLHDDTRLLSLIFTISLRKQQDFLLWTKTMHQKVCVILSYLCLNAKKILLRWEHASSCIPRLKERFLDINDSSSSQWRSYIMFRDGNWRPQYITLKFHPYKGPICLVKEAVSQRDKRVQRLHKYPEREAEAGTNARDALRETGRFMVQRGERRRKTLNGEMCEKEDKRKESDSFCFWSWIKYEEKVLWYNTVRCDGTWSSLHWGTSTPRTIIMLINTDETNTITAIKAVKCCW